MSDITVTLPVWMVEDAIRILRIFEDETVEAMRTSPLNHKMQPVWDQQYEQAFQLRRQLEGELIYAGVWNDD